MKQEEFEAKREEFLAIWAQVASIPRPRLDYSTLSNATFAGIEFIRRLMEIQAFFMAYYRATGKLPVTNKEIEYILVTSTSLTRTKLAAIYCGCSDAAVVGLLLDLKIEELFIGDELEKRLLDKRIGTVLILAPRFGGPQPSEKWYENTFQMKLGPKDNDKLVASKADDLPEASFLRALELAANLEATSYEPGPLPSFPLEMTPHESSFWNVYLGKVWQRGHETLRQGLIPVLNGDAESIPKSAANYRDEERKKASRQWKMLHGIKQPPATELDPRKKWRAEWDISELAADKMHPDTEAVHVGVNSGISPPEDSFADREIGQEAYDYVLSRFGEDGSKFLDELIANEGNVQAASEAVGISRQTGHKWKKKIEIFLRTKNLTK